MFSDKRYRRPRAKAVPAGWVAVEALVDHVDSKTTMTRFGEGTSAGEDYVLKATVHYVILGQGTLHGLVLEGKFLDSDTPRAGDRETIAYDPGAVGEIVVLENDKERVHNRLLYAKRAAAQGSEARVTVTALAPTGRALAAKVAPPEPSRSVVLPWARKAHAKARDRELAAQHGPVPEMMVTLRAQPSGADPFEVTVPYWDRDGIGVGSEGVLFFHPHEPAQGFLQFPHSEHRGARDPVQAVRDHLRNQLLGYTG